MGGGGDLNGFLVTQLRGISSNILSLYLPLFLLLFITVMFALQGDEIVSDIGETSFGQLCL